MKLSKETIRLKIRNTIYIPITSRLRKKKLEKHNFTIISNNCWGGTIYESYGLKKQSPTVGMFFMPEDYLKFCGNINHYLSQPLTFIHPKESKWKKHLQEKSNWGTYLIGQIEDVELQMLHYHDEEVAKRKWEDRVGRINWNCMIYKFNDQNGATKADIEKFMELPLDNKICFVSSSQMKVSSNIKLIKQPQQYQLGVKASREPFGKSKYIDITEYINNLGG